MTSEEAARRAQAELEDAKRTLLAEQDGRKRAEEAKATLEAESERLKRKNDELARSLAEKDREARKAQSDLADVEAGTTPRRPSSGKSRPSKTSARRRRSWTS